MRKQKSKTVVAVIAAVLCILVLAAILITVLNNRSGPAVSSAAVSGADSPAANASSPSSSAGQGQSDYAPLPLPEEMRAMWISFLEWQQMDISTEAALRAAVGPMFDNCVAMGLNTVIAAVRPFGDALYQSELYPWSHLITGTQGQNPGYDPLAVLCEEAHARGLRIEAWINPYRVSHVTNGPDALAADNPAVLHPEWLREAAIGKLLDPGLPEVQQLVAGGVAEILQGYPVDGINFDDYFYPEFSAEEKESGYDTEFDAATYAAFGGVMGLSEWRRHNVNTLVQAVYQTVKSINPAVPFGISPQGNNENNYQIQFSDVKLWMANTGYVDYVMPQLYWGFNYRTAAGRENYAFENICAEWAAYPRIPQVRLFAALGAYRIGVGDNGSNDQAEWSSGHNLADMVRHLRTVNGFSGFSLFRYEFLYNPGEPLAAGETAALTELLQA